MRVPRRGAGSQVSRVSPFRRVLHARATLVRPVHLRRRLRLARSTLGQPSGRFPGPTDDFWPLGESNGWTRTRAALVWKALARAGGHRIDPLSRSGSSCLALGAESVPRFRLHKETIA